MLLDDTNVSIKVDDEVPFARRAREHGKCYRGGKPDDIAVVVCVAVDGAVEEASDNNQKPIKAKL